MEITSKLVREAWDKGSTGSTASGDVHYPPTNLLYRFPKRFRTAFLPRGCMKISDRSILIFSVGSAPIAEKFKIYGILMYLDPSFSGIYPTPSELGEIVSSASVLTIDTDIHAAGVRPDFRSTLI